jgi:hypothetical protein
VDLDDVIAPKKQVSFAANDNVIGASWSTVLSGSASEDQRSTSSKQVSFAVDDEEIVGSSSTTLNDKTGEDQGAMPKE